MKNIIVSVLFIVVSRQVVAQVDSNSIVSIRLSKLCGSCGLEIQTLPIEDTVWSAPFLMSQESLCILLDTSFKISKLPGDAFGLTISFKIDSIYSCFRNIWVARRELDHIPWNGGVGTLDVMNDLEVYFDSLPFTAAAGHIIGKDVVHYQNVFTSSLLTMAILHTQFKGGCSTSGRGMDSLVLDVAPSSPSSVSQSGFVPFQVRTVGGNLFIEFPMSNSERQLHIYDVLGREVETHVIHSGNDDLQTPLRLSPGQFFARLSNETIRFIINKL